MGNSAAMALQVNSDRKGPTGKPDKMDKREHKVQWAQLENLEKTGRPDKVKPIHFDYIN
jgi:hypothetical protein